MLEISLDHGKLYKGLHMASNCTFNSRLDGIKDLSVPKKAVWTVDTTAVHGNDPADSAEMLIHQTRLPFSSLQLSFFGECGATRDSNCCFWQMHVGTKELFSISKLFHVLGCFPVKSVHLCGHHFSNYSPLTSRHLDNLAYCIIFVFHHSYYCLENPISYSRNTQTSPNQQQSANN